MTEQLVFSYGSNMAACRIHATNRAPSAVKKAVGWLNGYRLTFDKKSKDGSGKCDCERTGDPADRVYGVVYQVAATDMRSLGSAEGYPGGYDKITLEVTTANGVLKALAYIATRKELGLWPYHWYKEHVLRGAKEHELPSAYIQFIAAVKSVPDPDSARAAKEMAIWAK